MTFQTTLTSYTNTRETSEGQQNKFVQSAVNFKDSKITVNDQGTFREVGENFRRKLGFDTSSKKLTDYKLFKNKIF